MRTDVSGWQVRLDAETIERHTRSGAWSDRTVSDLAERLAAADPERVTHVFDSGRYGAAELLVQAEALAAALHARGLRTGDAISFQLPNWVEAVVIDLAASLLGLVVVPIIPIYRETEVAYMLADCRAKAAFVPGEYRGY